MDKVVGTEVITKIGMDLRLPLVSISSANLLFQKVVAEKHITEDMRKPLYGASILVACKGTDVPIRIRPLANSLTTNEMTMEEFWVFRDRLVDMELELLHFLQFDVGSLLACRTAYDYLGSQLWALGAPQDVCQLAWALLNDIYHTPHCIEGPELLAISCAVVAAQARGVSLNWNVLPVMHDAEFLEKAKQLVTLMVSMNEDDGKLTT